MIRNEGQADLVLVKGSTSCKCTLSEMARNSIPPGESGEVTLTWTADQPQPTFSKSADIHTNDPENLVIRLEIRGTIDELIRIEPPDVWSAGTISGSEPRVLKGVIQSAFLDEFQIHELISSSEAITAEATAVSADTLAIDNAKSGYIIQVTVNPIGPIGPFNEELTLRTDIRGGTDLKVRVMGHRQGPFQIVPFPPARWYEAISGVGLGRFSSKAGETGKLAMFVDLPPGQELNVEVGEVAPEFLKVTLERDTNFVSEAKARYSLKIEVPPGLPPTTRTGENAGTITFRTNHPSAPEFQIKVGFVIFRAS